MYVVGSYSCSLVVKASVVVSVWHSPVDGVYGWQRLTQSSCKGVCGMRRIAQSNSEGTSSLQLLAQSSSKGVCG